jgi:AcrR family transcriptional regulator
MSERVNRRYVAPKRVAAAAQTRDRILRAAHALFVAHGWEGTPVSEIARRAKVSVDTVYASVGRKPVLIREVIDDVLGQGRGPVPAEQRSYVADVRAAGTAEDKITIYATALGHLMPQVAPLLLTLRDAGASDPECAQAWREISERRARNMLGFAADLRQTGRLRVDLPDRAVADLVWATNSPEYYTLLRSRGWSERQYAEHLSDLWRRLLLAP